METKTRKSDLSGHYTCDWWKRKEKAARDGDSSVSGNEHQLTNTTFVRQKTGISVDEEGRKMGEELGMHQRGLLGDSPDVPRRCIYTCVHVENPLLGTPMEALSCTQLGIMWSCASGEKNLF
ncbi:unnamed protein product [Allacma fusca]|uniref:Uncharacterized protein n=1 Tax=Allacma fusca TaxID=39272 RepID=A0A8J2LXW1_9HEXA|nr:unnamed protein product [Allacma fusca]